MKKIIIDKGEGIAEVIDRILSESDDEIAIVVPKNSALGRSVSNFHLLKREADSAGRKVVVESVDDTILAFAKESGIESVHPLWKGVRGEGGMSDIVPRHEAEALEAAKEKRRSIGGKRPNKKEAIVEEPEEEERDEDGEENDETFEEEKYDGDDAAPAGNEKKDGAVFASMRKRFFDGTPKLDRGDDDDDADNNAPGRSFGATVAWIIGVIVVASVAIYVVTMIFDHADITINFTQTPWSYQNNFTADKNAVGIDPTTNTIPATVFTMVKNITETSTASAVAQVSQKAQGMITIYNDYSAKPQELVATTRFLTPDGKIFRIVSTVTVPGETTVGGELSLASITVPIVADQPGPDYNIGPVSKLTIPGFANDPGREAGFYGTITASTTNGFIGTRATPTAADIAAAKASTTATLQQLLPAAFSTTYPNNFKILAGAMNVQVGTLTVNTTTDANGDFTVFGEATLTAIGFDESALKDYLLSLAQAQEASSTFKSVTLNYTSVVPNFTTGQVSFALSVQASLEPALTVADFVTGIEGESIAQARSTVSALPNLTDGEISLWPSWLWTIPSDPAKIHVTVN
jgi:hypothetical protein